MSEYYRIYVMDVMARSRNKHICLGFCLKPSIGPSYRKVLFYILYTAQSLLPATLAGCLIDAGLLANRVQRMIGKRMSTLVWALRHLLDTR